MKKRVRAASNPLDDANRPALEEKVLIARSAALVATIGWLGMVLGPGAAGAVAEGPTTQTGSEVDARSGAEVSIPPDPVRSELREACIALRDGGFEGTYMFRRTNHGQHYRCEKSGSLQPIRAREFRRARCRCPRAE